MKSFAFLCLLLTFQTLPAQSDISWSQIIPVASGQFDNMHPRVVLDGAGNPLIIWGNGNTKQVFFTRWTGNGFAAPVNLNPDVIPIFAASWSGPDIASHGDTVYVVFKETPEHTNGIYLVRSFNGGQSFSDPERVDAIGDSISRFPSVSTDALGNPLVAFMKFDPGWGNARYVLTRSNDYGSTFGTDILGSRFSGGDVCDCCPASVTSSGNTVALLYRDNLNNLRNSWTGISLDAGNSFAGGIEIDKTDWTINACPSSGPDGVIYQDTLYSVFMSAASGKALCYRSHSSISGLQIESMEALTGNFTGLGQQNFPRIASAGKAVAVIWVQTANGNTQLAIQFTNNISNGFPGGYDVLAPNYVSNADVAISSNGKVYVVWEDMNTGTVLFKYGEYIVSSAKEPFRDPETFKVYPNPVTNSNLYLEFRNPTDEMLHYGIYNAQGQEVIAGKEQSKAGILQINVSEILQGAYFIRVKNNDQAAIKSFIIQKE
ncbi:MAG: T9SS type A sorting domain-containing protein [Saprospiraceae bacterium]